MIRTIVIKNYKSYQDTTIDLNEGINILVGNNEAGKSTVLEAVHLALTNRIGRLPAIQALTHHLINRTASKTYLASLQNPSPQLPPEIIIELYLHETPQTAHLKGTNNTRNEDTPGIRLWIHFDHDYADEYDTQRQDPTSIRNPPTEYYKVEWLAFSANSITQRSISITASLIDAAKMRLQSGTDYYLQRILQESLTTAQRVKLARTYAELKDTFAETPEIKGLNADLEARKTGVTDKLFTLGMDTSPTSAWEASLVPHLDDLPLGHAGGGEQNIMKILLALTKKPEDEQANIVLIEEPENHLSYPRLNQLVNKIHSHCKGQQVLLTTHSSFVLNKLGLQQLLLLKNQKATRLTALDPDTQDYFLKLSGYDTLRVVLADRVILVEGPSDDLIVQRAYNDLHQHLPIEDGIDVISVRGLSFKRFLDIAVLTGTRVCVVTDNDGSYESLDRKYAGYDKPNIKICASNDNTLRTLEPQLVAVNTLEDLNRALGTTFVDKQAVLASIGVPGNKTEAALKVFSSATTLQMPGYLVEAIAWARQ